MSEQIEKTNQEISQLQATIKNLSKKKNTADVAQVKRLTEKLKVKRQYLSDLTEQKKADDKNKSAEVKSAESAHARAMADAQSEADTRTKNLDDQKQKKIDDKRASSERVARKLDAEEAKRKKVAKKKADAEAKELATPLSTDERTKMLQLEAQANKGRNQPDGMAMLELSRLRIRAKIEG